MPSLLFPFSAIVPNSFILPSQPDSSSPSLPPPLLAGTSSAMSPPSLPPPLLAGTSSAMSAAATSSAAPAAAVAAGFMARVKAPLVPPGFGPLRPNIYPQLNRPNLPGNGNAASSSAMSGQADEAVTQAMMGQLRILASGFDTMQKEIEQLKRRSGHQGGLITGLKEAERAFEESKKAIGSLEDNVGLLISHAQEKERVIRDLEGKVVIVEGENKELRKDVGDLREKIGEFKRVFKKVCIGGSIIIGGAVFVGGVIALIKKK